MNPSTRLMLLFAALTTACSCSTPKKVTYMEDASQFNKQKIPDAYQIRIENDDQLSIVVSSKDTALSAPFNRTPGGQGYLVNTNGMINYPIFGEIKAAGFTPESLSLYLRERMIRDGYIRDPAVSVKLVNFKISVMGEVNKPGVYAIPTQRVTIMEALSLAGDLSIFGRRDKVLVVRESDGHRDMQYVDISSTGLFNSPYYYLRQNDLVYVEPNKSRVAQSDYNPKLPLILSAITVLTSLASLIIVSVK